MTDIRIFRAIDKLDRVGINGVYDLLTRGRMDESGDFTEGCGLSKYAALKWVYFIISSSAKNCKFGSYLRAELNAAIAEIEAEC